MYISVSTSCFSCQKYENYFFFSTSSTRLLRMNGFNIQLLHNNEENKLLFEEILYSWRIHMREKLNKGLDEKERRECERRSNNTNVLIKNTTNLVRRFL